MKRDMIFSIVWCIFSYIMQYAYWSFSIYFNNIAEGHFGTRSLLNTIGVPLVGYIILGLLIGVLALNIRFFSRASRLITLGFVIYLVLRIPLMMVSDVFSYIYPRWMMLYIHDTTTWFGGIVISISIINIWHEQLTLLTE